MIDSDLLTRYNYDEFVPVKFEPWQNFAASPPLWAAQLLTSRCGIWM